MCSLCYTGIINLILIFKTVLYYLFFNLTTVNGVLNLNNYVRLEILKSSEEPLYTYCQTCDPAPKVVRSNIPLSRTRRTSSTWKKLQKYLKPTGRVIADARVY